MSLIGAIAMMSQLGNLALNMANAHRRDFCVVKIPCPGSGEVMATCNYAIRHVNDIIMACNISRILRTQTTITRINTPRTFRWV